MGPAAYAETVNPAEVTTSSPDPVEENDTTTDTVTVPPQVDLEVQKALAGDLVVGETARYTLEVTNHGPTAEPGPVTVTDRLPKGLTPAGSEGEGWSCEADGQVVTCTLDGPLAVDQSTTLALDVEVGPGAHPEALNTATVGSPSEDTNPENDTDEVTSPVTPTVELGIAKDVSSRDGARVTYRIQVTNEGPSDTVSPVVVRDALPETLELVDVQGEDWSCQSGPGSVTCTYADPLPVGGSADLRVATEIQGTPREEIVNIATVSGGGDDDESSDRATSDPPAVDDDGGSGDDTAGDDTAGDGGSADDGRSGADGSGGLLPDTGGFSPWALLAGLLLLTVGGWTLRRQRAPERGTSTGGPPGGAA